MSPGNSPAEQPLREVLVGEGLVVQAGSRRILDVERIGVRAGEILAVLGPNGAGKTTLLRVLAMLQKPGAGRVSVPGSAAGHEQRHLRSNLAVVFQRPHLWAGTVRANIELGLRLRRLPPREVRERAEQAAVRLQVAHLLDERSTDLSSGEAQRIAVARALALEPRILMLDEPTANLDAEVRASLREDLERLARERSRSTILATHDRAEAFFLADRVAVLVGGRLVQAGTPAELYEEPLDPYIAAVTGAEFSFRGWVEGVEDGLLQIRLRQHLFTAVGSGAFGDEVKVVYRPEDLFLSRGEPAGGSARNRFTARVLEVRPAGGLLRLRLQGPVEMVAVVTRAAGADLDLRAGASVSVQIKATAMHAFPI